MSCFLAVLLGIALSGREASSIESRKNKKVLIIGIDGCRPDALAKADIPNLRKLIDEGAFSDKAQTCDITASGPCWTSMLTGVWREKHGVRGNGFEGANLKEFPHFFRRLNRLDPRPIPPRWCTGRPSPPRSWSMPICADAQAGCQGRRGRG